jgi:hypothetical protein
MFVNTCYNYDLSDRTQFSALFTLPYSHKGQFAIFHPSHYEDINEEKMGLSTELMAMVKAGAAMEVVETMMKNVSTERV